jgi:uncharacterized iron-regulated membrane protein
MKNIHSLVVLLRRFRTIHKYVGIALALFFLLIATTGVLLGWKKNVETLQPKTYSGVSTDYAGWKSFKEVGDAAILAMDTVVENPTIDRMDVRFDKGIAKVLFTEGYWEAQVDCTSGEVFAVAQRHSDWIEHLHDGSLISDGFKLLYTNLLGIGLFTLALSGLWLWYGPKVIRASK